MKILFVISSVAIEGGGASKMLVWVANQFAKKGWNVTIYTHKTQNGPLFDLDSSIEVISTEPVRGKSLFYPIPCIRGLIKKLKPNCIVSFMQDSNLYCILAKLGTKIPVIACERNDPFLDSFWKNRIAQRIIKYANSSTYQLQEISNYYSWVTHPKYIIPNPVAESKHKVTKCFMERRDEICNYARLDIVQKRQDVLIRAFALVTLKHPEMTLVLYGEGKDRKKLEKLVLELNLEKKVIFKGMVESPVQYCIESKLFVLSSDYEGISNSLTEAMAAGLTVISTDTSPGGSRFLINDGENGVLVQRGNIYQLAEKICFCLENPDLCDKMSKEATQIVNTFSETNIFSLWENIVNETIK